MGETSGFRLSGRGGTEIVALMMVVLAAAWLDGSLVRTMKMDDPAGRCVAGWGYLLGHGNVGIPAMLVLAGLGWLWKKPRLKSAGSLGLWAFLLSGAFSQAIKHVIGRPRPRLWEQGVSHWGPSFVDGLNSFPSGHTTTSMAVALVLSWHYPKASPLFMGLAAFVAAARIIGGSHFPTDVLGGVMVGLFTGWGVLVVARFGRGGSLFSDRGGARVFSG